MKNYLKISLRALLITIGLTLINCILLVLSFCLPTGIMREHVAESVPLIDSEEMYLRWDWGYTTTQVDGQSEYNIYGMAINEDSEGSAIEKAMFLWYPDGEDMPRDDAIAAYARHDDVHFDYRTYTRYWNGSVMFLKLLLLLFSIQDIRMINFFIQITLLLVIIWLMAKQNMDKFILPFIAGILFINPFTMVLSVKYSAEYYPMLFCILIILLLGEKIEDVFGGWEILFAITGAITSFFSMLSFPGIALGIPILFVLWKRKEKNAFATVIRLSAFWGVSYGVTWSMKWVIGTCTTSYNFLGDAISQMFKYQGNNTVTATPIERFMRTLWCIYNPVYVMYFLIMCVLVVAFTLVLVNKTDCNGANNLGDAVGFSKLLVAYTVIALIPFFIIFVLGNGYAYVHAYMAHRHYAISVTAVLCIISMVSEKIKGFLSNKK